MSCWIQNNWSDTRALVSHQPRLSNTAEDTRPLATRHKKVAGHGDSRRKLTGFRIARRVGTLPSRRTRMAAPAYLETWSEFVTPDAAMAPFTTLKLGGPAAALVRPPDAATLAAVLQACRQQKAQVHFLGNGSNILVKDEGFPGIVIRFSDPSFQTITVSSNVVSARTGASLGALVSTAARHNLGGLESLVGLPGTGGGALKNDLKVKTGPLSQFVSRVELLNAKGDVTRHNRDDVPFEQLLNAPDAPVILGAEFHLHGDQPEGIVKRLRKNW